MKIFSFLLLLTFSISILNANPPQKELNCHAELDSVQLIGNNYQQNELQREKIQKEYLFKPDSIWGTDLLGMIISSDFYTYHNNHIGTPLFMTDLNGNKVWEAETDSFGNVDIALSGIENNIRLAGQYFDAETGLHYNWNRYYDPTTGRYISQDPIGFAGGISLYGYVGQNPINSIDPFGLQTTGEVLDDLAQDIRKEHGPNSWRFRFAAASYIAWSILGPESVSKVADNAINGRNDMKCSDYFWATLEMMPLASKLGKGLKAGGSKLKNLLKKPSTMKSKLRAAMKNEDGMALLSRGSSELVDTFKALEGKLGNMGEKEFKRLASKWDPSTLKTYDKTFVYHANKHTNGNIDKLLRGADNFNKKGAHKIIQSDGSTKWLRPKSDEFLIERTVNGEGKIVSWGK